MSSLRRRPRSPAPLEDDELLSEIHLRLPPQPSSLPRASVVCKRWRGLVTDPRFSRRFRLCRRRTPPLLGFFHHQGAHNLSFFPTLEAPNRVPPGRFSLELDNDSRLLGCRHGLALILDEKPPQFLAWDPVTGEQHHLAIPPWLVSTKALVSGAVVHSAAAGDVQVQHYKVVLAAAHEDGRMLACVYSSETGMWVVRAEGGGLGFLFVSNFTAQARLWKRKTDCDGVVSWGLTRAIELDKLLSLNLKEKEPLYILGYAEDNNVLLLWTVFGIFTVQLESLQFKKFPRIGGRSYFLPFESVYTAGTGIIGGGHGGAELLHNT